MLGRKGRRVGEGKRVRERTEGVILGKIHYTNVWNCQEIN